MARNPAERLDDSSAGLRKAIQNAFTDLHDRLTASEASVVRLLANQSGLVDGLVAQITNQFSALFTDADQLVTAIRNAEFLSAATETPVSFIIGQTATLLLDAGDNFPFVPSSVVGLTLPGNTDDYAFAKVTGWVPSTRALSIEIFAVAGEAGPHTGATVEIGAFDTLIMETIRSAVVASQAQVTLDAAAAVDAKNVAVPAAGAAAASANAAHEDRLAAEAAAMAAATWDPVNYYDKSTADGRYAPKGPIVNAGLTMPTASVLMRTTAGTGAVEAKNAAALLAFLGSGGPAANKLLRGDGTWDANIDVGGSFLYGTEKFLDPGSDLDVLLQPGPYSGYSLLHAPEGSGAVFYVRVYKHAGLDDFVLQVATDGTSGALPRRFIRRRNAGAWGAWKEFTFDVATAANYRAKAAGKVLTADGVLAAAAWVTLTDAATVALDFASFENGYLTVAGNRTLGNPSNVQVGITKNIVVQGNDATLRTLSFGSNFKGDLPTMAVNNSNLLLLSLFAITASHIVVTSARAL